METSSRDDIRRLLKTFGIAADEAILSHMARHPGPRKVRLSLQDLTDYQGSPPAETLSWELEGEIRA